MNIHFFHAVHYKVFMPKFICSIQSNWTQFLVFYLDKIIQIVIVLILTSWQKIKTLIWLIDCICVDALLFCPGSEEGVEMEISVSAWLLYTLACSLYEMEMQCDHIPLLSIIGSTRCSLSLFRLQHSYSPRSFVTYPCCLLSAHCKIIVCSILKVSPPSLLIFPYCNLRNCTSKVLCSHAR